MQAGDIVRWKGEDFSYEGQIVEIKDGRVLLNSTIGLMSFPEDDGKLKLLPKDTELDLDAVKAKASRAIKTAKQKGYSKKQQEVIDWLKKYVDDNGMPTRQEALQMLQNELGLKSGTASTYFATAKNVVNV